ncbi:TonB-dependent receptor [bacterium]|nr:TonB-dependent receptor [bacterium]
MALTPDPRPGKPGTREKALRINLDLSRYGTFAEIGAGQEVVRWFFRVGGAAGTVAKSISAYDMAVSDAYYGPCERYVCRQRLQSMLDAEFEGAVRQLGPTRGDAAAFFAFADTVSARNYKGTNECHGWLGVKFQARPHAPQSQVIIHVRMLDAENAQQQEALGVVGVNLLYGAFAHHHEPGYLVDTLLDDLSVQRLEVDMIEFSGDAFREVDNRVMSLKLVQLGLTDAAMFAADGTVLQPSEVLYKKRILVERGSFRPVTHVHLDLLRCARETFLREPEVRGETVVQLAEITMRSLLAGGEVDYRDFLARADLLAAEGLTVLISDYFEYYRLAAYLARHTKQRIGIAMGIAGLRELFNEKYYTGLEGGILESFGRLFKNDLKLYIYPHLDPATGEFTAVQNLEVAPSLRKLYGYLVDRGCIEQLNNFDEKYLPIFAADALKKIGTGDPSWEEMVPSGVAGVIKHRGYFGYRPAPGPAPHG